MSKIVELIISNDELEVVYNDGPLLSSGTALGGGKSDIRIW